MVLYRFTMTKQLAFIFIVGIIQNFVLNGAYAISLKVASFNVSMEATNYLDHQRDDKHNVPADTLLRALQNNHQQIKNIAEIIQHIQPDIILLNEFDNQANANTSSLAEINIFIKQYLNVSQNGQPIINFPYVYQGPVNTGVNSGLDYDGNGIEGELPADGYGYGHFPGHYGMVLLSKYPIDVERIRTFQNFKWSDMPGALKPINPTTKKAFFTEEVWSKLRLSSKSHWDIPIIINGSNIHILASHPTPPVFDGPENRNGKRNHDEIRFWGDYISSNKSHYIYDDNGIKGGLANNQSFIILGDLNASLFDGDAIVSGIASLLHHDKIQDPQPVSMAAKKHSPTNLQAQYHTALWRMRADYVLASKQGLNIINSGVFWPLKTDKNFNLVKDRRASSDHRLVWAELATNNMSN